MGAIRSDKPRRRDLEVILAEDLEEPGEYGYVGENRHMVRSFLAGKRPDENFDDGVNVTELLMTAT